MANDLLQQWYKYVQLLINRHGKLYAAGVLTGWLLRLSKNDPCIRFELEERIKKLEKET